MSGVFNIGRLDAVKWIGKGMLLAERFTQKSMNGYHKVRLVVMGPVRNGLLISRELVRRVGVERGWRHPKGLWPDAKREYIHYYDTLFPRNEQGNLSGLVRRTKELSWKQVGEGALILGEILSLYYIGKFTGLLSKKTIRAIL